MLFPMSLWGKKPDDTPIRAFAGYLLTYRQVLLKRTRIASSVICAFRFLFAILSACLTNRHPLYNYLENITEYRVLLYSNRRFQKE